MEVEYFTYSCVQSLIHTYNGHLSNKKHSIITWTAEVKNGTQMVINMRHLWYYRIQNLTHKIDNVSKNQIQFQK